MPTGYGQRARLLWWREALGHTVNTAAHKVETHAGRIRVLPRRRDERRDEVVVDVDGDDGLGRDGGNRLVEDCGDVGAEPRITTFLVLPVCGGSCFKVASKTIPN